MDKLVMLIYNEAIDEEVMALLERSNVKNYTKIAGTFGKGESSGTHMGDDIWPGRNKILYIACAELQAKALLAGVRQLRKELGREGIKAFLMPIEEVT